MVREINFPWYHHRPLRLEQTVNFSKVKKIWKESEKNVGWEEHFQKRGYNSWLEWRRSYFQGLNLTSKQFKVFRITDPLIWVPQLYCGSYTSWYQLYPNRTKATFERVLEKNYEFFVDHSKVEAVRQKYKEGVDYTLIGMQGEFLGEERIMLLDGHHRAIAIAMMLEDPSLGIFNSNVKIAIADYMNTDKDREIFERAFMIPFRHVILVSSFV